MRRLALLALAAAAISACSTKVDPVNPWDSDTPEAGKAKARVTGRILPVGMTVPGGLEVRLKQNGALVDQTVTASDGSFVFNGLTPGAYVVESTPSGYVKYAEPVTLAAGQVAALPDADLALDTSIELATLKGIATLENQITFGGILVEVVGRATTVITNSAGEYQLGVPEGTYDLRFVRADFVTTTVSAVPATLGNPVDVAPVELPVNPATVQGQVVAETLAGGTAPLVNALVTLEGTSNTGLTGADGSFALTGIYAGSYLLRVVKTGYLDASTPVIGLTGGEVRTLSTPLSVQLARGGIVGTVQLADSADASGAIVEATGTAVATVTGASGAFQLNGLVEGSYEVTLRKDGYAAAVRSAVSVTAGTNTSVGTITLARQGGTIAIVQGAVTNTRNITVQLNAPTATGYRISQDPTFTDAAQGDTLTAPASPRPYSGPGSTHAFTLDDLDGRHTLYVLFYDGASASTPSSASIVLDRLGPAAPSVVVEDGAPFTRNTVVGLALSAQDLPAVAGAEVSGLAQVQIASNAAFTGATTLAFAVSTTWSIGAGDGAKTVYVRFTDKAGNVSAPAQATITLDTTPPTAPSIALSGGTSAPPGFTGSPLVTATLAAADANAGAGGANLQVKLSNSPGLGGSTWQPFATSVPWFVTAGDELKTVYAQFMDPAGNTSVVTNGTITLAATAPSSGTVVVESGAASTNKTTVAVAISASGATQMRLSINGTPVAAGWIPYASATTLNVTAAPDETVASISANFRNTAGVEGGSASTSILIDRRAPTSPSVSIAGGAAYAGAVAVTLDVSAVESPAAAGIAAGLDRVEVANNAAFTGSQFFPMAATVPWTLPAGDGAKTVYARFIDKAGNVSASTSDSITLDTLGPTAPTLSLAGNPEAQAGTTGTPIVTATLSATDVNEGAGKANLEVRVSNDLGFAASSWQPYATSLAWVLTPGDGAKTVYAQFRDRAGNVSATASANITLSGTAPSNGALVIEGGAASTNKASVTLALSATGATQMRLFLNGTAVTAWVTYATSSTVAVSALPDETPAVIAVSFRGTGGVEGGGASASILVDRRAPTSPSVSINAGAAYAGSSPVTLSVSATDAPLTTGTASGLDKVEVANNAAFTGSSILPMADTVSWPVPAGDGAKTVYVRFLDKAGNVSASANDSIILDGTAPTAPTLALTGNPEATAGNTGTPIVTAALNATDANGGAGNVNLEVRISNTLGFAGAAWQPFAASLAWVLTPGDGLKTVYAQFRDPAGNVSATANGTITLASTPPSSGSLIIAGGAAATSTQTVAVAISATGATQMRLFVNGVASTGWVAYGTSANVDLGATPNEATRVVSVGFRNTGGVEGGGTSASIRFDTVAPAAGTLAVVGTLGNGTTSATLTATPAVVLQATPFTANTDVSQMALVQATTAATSCATMFASPQWQSAALSSTFVLTGTDEAKRICLLFRDGAGNFNTASAVAANITLDTTPPTNPAFVNVTSTIQNVALAPKTGNPTITAATDVNGVTYQCVGGNLPGYGSQWADCGVATTLPRPWNLIANSENTIGVRARDAAYNYSPGSFARIVHDDVKPTPPFIVDLRSSRDSVTVTWDATADTDVVDYLVYYGNSAGDYSGTGAAQGPPPIAVAPRAGQATGNFTLTGLTQGIPYYVAVEAVDAAGNKSGPSGQRAAVPNKANPRLLSSIAATPRSIGQRTTTFPTTPTARTYVYVATNQGITQLDYSNEIFPVVVGRAFLPDLVPDERSPIAVFDCKKGGADGHCVVPAGTTLEGDFRGDIDFYRAAAPIVFFPLTGTSTAPVVGTIEAILPTRPTHVATFTTGGITYLAAVDAQGIRAFTVSPTNPSLVRQVASVSHAAPVLQVLSVGLNGSELYMVARVDSRYFGGPADYPLVFGYELIDLPSGDLPTLFSEHGLQSNTGTIIGDTFVPGPDPVIMVDGGVYAMYYSSASGNTLVSSYNPALATPASTVTVYTAASSDGGYPDAGASGPGQLYLWTQEGLSPGTVRQVNVSGLTLTASTQYTPPSANSPFIARVTQNHLAQTRLLSLETSNFDPSVRDLRRWDITGATISEGSIGHSQIPPEWFAWTDHTLYVSQGSIIHSVEVSNPYLPNSRIIFSPLTLARNFTRLYAHGRFLYAAFAPAIFGTPGGVGIFKILGNGGLQNNGNALNPAPLRILNFPNNVSGRDMAVVGRWLFATGSDGGLRAYNLAPGGAADNPALSIPVQVGATLAGAFDQIDARRDFSGVTSYEAVIYATVGDTLVTYGWNGATFTNLNAGVTFPSNQAATSVDVAGNYGVVGTPGGSYLYSVSTPASPFITGAAVYPIAGPTRLQGGYLVGLSASNDASGPAFTGRSAGAVDGSIRFSTCEGGASRSLTHDDGLYAASCGRNGIAFFTPGALEGMRLMKSYDVSPTWSSGAAYATDGMLGWLGGPIVWNGSANESQRLFQVSEESAAEGSLSAPFFATSITGADNFRGAAAMVEQDGILYVATTRIASNPTLDAYEATTPYTFLGRYTFVGTDNPVTMVTDGDYAYVARNGANAQVDVIDIRNPAAMFLRVSSAVLASRTIASLTISRDRLYAGLFQGSAQVHEIRVWDTSSVHASATLPALTTVAPPAEGSITGVGVVGNTIVWTVHDPVFRVPLFGLGIGTLGANRDGTGFVPRPGGLVPVSDPLQSPVISGDTLYVAANLGLQAWDLRGWWIGGGPLVAGGAVSLADPHRLFEPVKLHVEGPFAYLVGGTFRSFDLR